MNRKTTIQDLPNEMLEHILLQLEMMDRKSALQVCRRWSLLKPFNWSLLKLAIKFSSCKQGEEESYCQCFLASNRSYKQLDYYYDEKDDAGNFKLFLKIWLHFQRTVESLMLICDINVFPDVKIFAGIAAFGSNLRYLNIDCRYFIHDGVTPLPRFKPMPKVEELVVSSNIFTNAPIMEDLTPNIKRLYIMHYDESAFFFLALRFLRHVSCNLVELSIKLDSHEDFLMFRKVKFTRLEKLQLDFARDSEPNPLEINRFMADFSQQSPGLVDVGLHTVRLTTQNMQNLCRKCPYLQCLDVHMAQGDGFAAICELKHLKRLTIHGCIIVPTTSAQLRSLYYLSLSDVEITDATELNRFIRNNLPSLTILKLLNLKPAPPQKFDLLRKICNNITSLQQLAVSEDDVSMSEFLEFSASCAPRDLTFHCWNMNDTPSVVNSQLAIAVRTLTLGVLNIDSTMLRMLMDSMKELRRLEMTSTGLCTQRELNMVAEQYPRCKIFFDRELLH